MCWHWISERPPAVPCWQVLTAAALPYRKCTALPMNPFPRTADCTGTCRSSWKNWNRACRQAMPLHPMKASLLIRGAWTTVCWGQTAPCWNCRGIIGTAEQTAFCKRENSSCRQRNSAAGQAHRSWRSTRCFSCFVSGTAAALTSVPRFCQCQICLRIC